MTLQDSLKRHVSAFSSRKKLDLPKTVERANAPSSLPLSVKFADSVVEVKPLEFPAENGAVKSAPWEVAVAIGSPPLREEIQQGAEERELTEELSQLLDLQRRRFSQIMEEV